MLPQQSSFKNRSVIIWKPVRIILSSIEQREETNHTEIILNKSTISVLWYLPIFVYYFAIILTAANG